MSRDKTLRWRTFWAAVLCCAAAGVEAAEPNIDRIRQDWQARFAATKDFVYKTEGKTISPKGTMIIAGDDTAPESVRETGYPLEDLSRPYEIDWFVDLQAGLLRQEKLYPVLNTDTLESSERQIVEAFDGETLWTGRRDGEGGIALRPASRAEWFFTVDDLPFFFAHGIFPLKSLDYKDFSKQTAASLAITPEGTSVIGGRSCEVVRARFPGSERKPGESFDIIHLFHIDPLRQSAVLRIEKNYIGDAAALRRNMGIKSYPSGPVLGMSIDIGYQEVEDMWVPERIVKNVYDVLNAGLNDGNPGADLTQTIELEVTEVAINQGIDRALFAQPLSPGMIVRDDRDEGKKYTVADDKRTLVPLPRAGGNESTTSLPYWLAVGGVGCLLLYAGIMIFRRTLRR
ncbi:MAG: hypothetical protein M3552_09045 [Planctomycetota bacterium]|nr:hypothetical protein [Planctomycetota bacterium]